MAFLEIWDGISQEGIKKLNGQNPKELKIMQPKTLKNFSTYAEFGRNPLYGGGARKKILQKLKKLSAISGL